MYISQKRKYIDHIFANAQMMCVWLEQQWKTLLGVRVDFAMQVLKILDKFTILGGGVL
jgi:hypothetical protein